MLEGILYHLSRFHRHTDPSAAQEAMPRVEGERERVACGWNTMAPARSLWPADNRSSHISDMTTKSLRQLQLYL